MPVAKKLVVLCLNDFPIGVYSSPELAMTAAEAHKQKHYRGLDRMLYYHVHEFTLDERAHL